MATITWKLVVTPLKAHEDGREARVLAENWLSALRLARRQLGEDGGVPPGASCVMSADGEVTILDSSSRRRFVLSRVSEAELASERAKHAHELPRTEPAPPGTNSQNVNRADTAPKRSATLAYSPEESAAVHAQLAQARAPAPVPLPAAPVPVPAPAVHVPVPVPAPAVHVPVPVPAPAAPVPVPSAHVPAPTQPAKVRAATMAYSPEESRAIREQLVAAQNAEAAAHPQAAVSTPSATTRSRGTMAYVESPFAPASSTFVLLSTRDEEPSAASPIAYRERCLFAPSAPEPAVAEQGLRVELARVQATLSGRPRGQFVSLALFDHYFQGKPTRGPVATLVWKDWRGEPVFTWQGGGTEPNLPSRASDPVRSSFTPPVTHAEPAPSPVVVAPPPPAQEVAHAPAPRTPLPTPQSAADSWSSGNPLESTGDHDRRLSAAFEAVQDLYFLASSAEGLVFAVKLLQDLVPCEAATGGIYDINTDELRLVALTGTGSEERRAEAIPSSQGLLGAAALTTAEFLVINDVLSDPRFDPAIDGRVGMQTASMLLLPLRRDDNLLGLLQLINRRGGKPFSDADVAVCTYVARQVAEFMQSKRGQTPKRRR